MSSAGVVCAHMSLVRLSRPPIGWRCPCCVQHGCMRAVYASLFRLRGSCVAAFQARILLDSEGGTAVGAMSQFLPGIMLPQALLMARPALPVFVGWWQWGFYAFLGQAMACVMVGVAASMTVQSFLHGERYDTTRLLLAPSESSCASSKAVLLLVFNVCCGLYVQVRSARRGFTGRCRHSSYFGRRPSPGTTQNTRAPCSLGWWCGS